MFARLLLFALHSARAGRVSLSRLARLVSNPVSVSVGNCIEAGMAGGNRTDLAAPPDSALTDLACSKVKPQEKNNPYC